MGEISFKKIILSDRAIKEINGAKEKLTGLSRISGNSGEIWAELGAGGALMVNGRIGNAIRIRLKIPPACWGMVAD